MLIFESMSRAEIERVAQSDAYQVPSYWVCSCPERLAWYQEAWLAERDLMNRRKGESNDEFFVAYVTL